MGNQETSMRISMETANSLERIIKSLPRSERVRTKEDAVVWLLKNLTPKATKILDGDEL